MANQDIPKFDDTQPVEDVPKFEDTTDVTPSSASSTETDPTNGYKSNVFDANVTGILRGVMGKGALSAVDGAGAVAGHVLMHPGDITEIQKLKDLYRKYQQISEAQSDVNADEHPLATGIGMGLGILGTVAGPLMGSKMIQATKALPEGVSAAEKLGRVARAAVTTGAKAMPYGLVLGSANSQHNLINSTPEEKQQNLNDALNGAKVSGIIGGAIGGGLQGVSELASSRIGQKLAPSAIPAYEAGADGESLIGRDAEQSAAQNVSTAQDNLDQATEAAKNAADEDIKATKSDNDVKIGNLESAKKEAIKALKEQHGINSDAAEAQANKSLLDVATQTQNDIESALGDRGAAYDKVDKVNAGKTINQINSELATQGRDPKSVGDIDNFDDFVNQFNEGLDKLNSKNESYLKNEVDNVVKGPVRNKQVTIYKSETSPAVPGTIEKLTDKGELAVAQARQLGVNARYEIVPDTASDGRKILTLNVMRDAPPAGTEASSNPSMTASASFFKPAVPETTETTPITKMMKVREGGTMDPTYEQLRQLRTNLRPLRSDGSLTSADRNFAADQYDKLTRLMQEKFPGLQDADAGYATGIKFQKDIGNGLNNVSTLAKQGGSTGGSSISDLARQAKFQENLAAIRRFDPVLAQKIEQNFQNASARGQQILQGTQLQNQAMLNNLENQYQQQIAQAAQQNEAVLQSKMQQHQANLENIIQQHQAPLNQALQKQDLVKNVNNFDLLGLLKHPMTTIGKDVNSAAGAMGNIAGRLSRSEIPAATAAWASKYGGANDTLRSMMSDTIQPSDNQSTIPSTSTYGIQTTGNKSPNLDSAYHLYNASNETLQKVSGMLKNNKTTANAGLALDKYLKSGDQSDKARALFLIQQNDNAMRMLRGEE